MKDTPRAERRSQAGVAIVTVRGNDLKARCRAARVAARTLLVQPETSWPAVRPPIVLDTIGLELAALIALLADPPLLPTPARARQGEPVPQPRLAPLIAFADAADWRTLRLLALCPAVRLICGDDPALLRRWLPVLAQARWDRIGPPPIVWLLEPPPLVELDPLLLRLLAALLRVPALGAAAEWCGVSEATVGRVLRGTKQALGLPPGELTRFRPDELAALIVERLGADMPDQAQQR